MLINLPQLKCPVAQDNGMKTNLNHISNKKLNDVFCASSVCLVTSRLQLALTSSNNRIETLGLQLFSSQVSQQHTAVPTGKCSFSDSCYQFMAWIWRTFKSVESAILYISYINIYISILDIILWSMSNKITISKNLKWCLKTNKMYEILSNPKLWFYLWVLLESE